MENNNKLSFENKIKSLREEVEVALAELVKKYGNNGEVLSIKKYNYKFVVSDEDEGNDLVRVNTLYADSNNYVAFGCVRRSYYYNGDYFDDEDDYDEEDEGLSKRNEEDEEDELYVGDFSLENLAYFADSLKNKLERHN